MLKRTFIIGVITTNLFFVIVLLHKRAAFNEQIYQQHKIKHELLTLNKQEELLTNELNDLQSRNTVKAYAERYLTMMPIDLSDIKKIAV